MAFERITVDPERMGGLPCIRDLRLTVAMVLGQSAPAQIARKAAQQITRALSVLALCCASWACGHGASTDSDTAIACDRLLAFSEFYGSSQRVAGDLPAVTSALRSLQRAMPDRELAAEIGAVADRFAALDVRALPRSWGDLTEAVSVPTGMNSLTDHLLDWGSRCP